MDIASLTAGEIDDLIARLARRRAEVMPRVALSARELGDAPLNLCANPTVGLMRTDEGHLGLLLRHDGLGWIAYEFSDHKAHWLGNELLRAARVEGPVADSEPAKRGDTKH